MCQWTRTPKWLIANYVYNMKQLVEKFSKADMGNEEGSLWIISCLTENAFVAQEFQRLWQTQKWQKISNKINDVKALFSSAARRFLLPQLLATDRHVGTVLGWAESITDVLYVTIFVNLWVPRTSNSTCACDNPTIYIWCLKKMDNTIRSLI